MKSISAISIAMYVLFSAYYCSSAQNLILNPGFEFTTGCPAGADISKAFPWFNPTASSPDLYHPCIGPFAKSAHTGVLFAGIFTYEYAFTNAREYIETPLNSELVKNKKYCVEFFVSLKEGVKFAIAEIGAYFSPVGIYSNNYTNLPYQPQVVNPSNNVLKDTAWVLISGIYIAQGGEGFLTIGNFYTDSNTTFDTLPNFGYASYYYIDDVSVTLCDTCASPQAKFSAQRIDSAKVSFSNDAVGQSNSWHWNFGDGDTSNIENPVHVFDSVGEYDIVFIACDMWCCDTIKLRVDISKLSYVGVEEKMAAEGSSGQLKIYPNPNNGSMMLNYALANGQTGEIEILDVFGKLILRQKLSPGNRLLQLSDDKLLSGIYHYRISIDGVVRITDKLVLIK